MSKNGPPPVTLRDIARAIGISHAAVSLALRNSPRIGQAMRKRVQALANEMGYQQNAMAAGLAQFKRHSVSHPVHAALAWLNFWENPEKLREYKEFDGYWRGAEASARKFGYRLEEFICNKDMPLPRLEQILLARGIMGIFLPPASHTPDWVDFQWDKFSVVRFGRTIAKPEFHLVTSDQVANTALAFQKIREHGYQRIGLIEGHKRQNYGRLFKAGFLLAQSEMDKQSAIPVFSLNQKAPETNVPALAQWLDKEKPEALFSDTALGARLLSLCNRKVPEDIGLATTSILDGNADTGIDQHSEEIGRVAFLVLNSLIQDNDRGVPRHPREILVKGDWVDGKSLRDRSRPC